MALKKQLIFAFSLVACALAAQAETVFVQDRDVFVRLPNYDESKIAPYTLEDPLTFIDGRKVENAADWAVAHRAMAYPRTTGCG